MRIYLAGGVGMLMMLIGGSGTPAGETLYNGIHLPDKWPPRTAALTRDPLPLPPYLAAPPAVIPIDVGRQLFVDDFLVERTTLTRTYHLPQYHPASPVIRPDREWEGHGARARAGVFSDGVWHDPADGLFKAWYRSASSPADASRAYTGYATSRDGIHWEKPVLDVVPGTNVTVHDEEGRLRNSSTVWLDLEEKDPARRFKMFRVVTQEEVENGKRRTSHRMRISVSADGVHWRLAGNSDNCGDRSTVFYNPFRKLWVYSLRDGSDAVSRCRSYRESADFLPGARWTGGPGGGPKVLWVGADRLDPAREDLALRRVPERPWDLVPSQLYNLDCVAYESLMLGLFSIWRGHPLKDRPKINEVCVGYSRDGFHWTRPDRRAFCPVSENKEAWNYGNVQSAGGCCLVVGDQLYFYVGGTRDAASADPTATGLAILRRDGFASMDAGEQDGTLTTRPVAFHGRHCFVNVAAAGGELRAEILDPDGKPLAPFTRQNCRPLRTLSTIQPVTWQGAGDLAALAGKAVRFRFHLRNGRLYSFWVSPDASGASFGYVAAGGPGFTGPRDTVGRAARPAAAPER